MRVCEATGHGKFCGCGGMPAVADDAFGAVGGETAQVL
jgi:hypothetical protein